jgi:hypothetical protein
MTASRVDRSDVAFPITRSNLTAIAKSCGDPRSALRRGRAIVHSPEWRDREPSHCGRLPRNIFLAGKRTLRPMSCLRLYATKGV